MGAIEIDSLTKRYSDVTAVQNLELTVAPGEVFGFLGPNGAGKSTTFIYISVGDPIERKIAKHI